ncbi:MAG: hypothetical protein GXO77_05265 [Calditrichaeota bacterium]|nr:hypothetical protein [Calditrichota bacterium]
MKYVFVMIVLCVNIAFAQQERPAFENDDLKKALFASEIINVKTSSTDSAFQNDQKILLDGFVLGAVTGLTGAIIAYNTKTSCVGSSDVIQICVGDESNAFIGAAVGGTVGAVLGYLRNREYVKKSKKFPFLRVLIGSAVGGITGYYLSKYTYGITALALPAVGAYVSLQF